ncbi:hypothetical protein HanIR_Chr17g0888331 [Helianthus annuus]|nr:hypothetical protein HanIR_Chr17g0888331 [Helianthus annuus]
MSLKGFMKISSILIVPGKINQHLEKISETFEKQDTKANQSVQVTEKRTD